MNPELTAEDLRKPARGEYRLKQLADRRAHKAAEDKVMAEAKRRDHNKCRWPGCEHKGLLIEAAHLAQHRGMGGATLDRTQRHKLIALCVRHHDQLDGRTIPSIAIDPLDAEKGTDGLCSYYVQIESGEWKHVATEKYRGISEARGA